MNSGIFNSESKSRASRIAGSSRPMRDSGVAWIGEVPALWNVERLQWHCEEINVKNDPVQTENILSLTNDRGVIPYAEKGNQGNKAKENYSEYKVAFENTIIANSMNILIGSVGLSKYYGCVSPVYYIFKAKDNADIHFLDYLFQMRQFQRELRKYANGILEIRLRVSADDILKRKIAFPPLLEQRAIAAYLDQECGKIDGLRAKIEQQIEKLGEYKKSLITEAVTGKKKVERKGGGGQWKVSSYSKLRDSGVAWIGEVPEGWKIERFGYHFSFSKGLNITKADLTDTGVPVISYGQIHSKTNDGVHLRDGMLRFVPREIANANQSARLCLGDIVFADTSEDVEGAGNCVLIDREFEVFAGYHDIVAKAKCPENSKYFAYLFQSSAWRSQVRANVNGIKVFSITQRVFKDVDLLLPPLSEQREIAAYLDEKCGAIDAMVEKCRGELEKLAEYKKSLIFECVTGKKEVA